MTVVDVVTPYSPKHTSQSQLERAKNSVEKQSIETNHIVVEDSEQEGVAWARNQGIKQSENRFVAFLDADDYWKPEKLESQLEKAKTGDAGIVVTDSYSEKGDVGLTSFARSKTTSEKQFLKQLILGGITSVTSSILIDREKLDSEKFDETYYRFEDHEYILRCARKAGLAVVPEELTFIEKTKDGLSNNTERIPQIKSRIRLLKRKEKEFGEDYAGAFNQALAVQYRWLAREKLRRGDSSQLLNLYERSLSRKTLPKTLAAMALDLPRGVLT